MGKYFTSLDGASAAASFSSSVPMFGTDTSIFLGDLLLLGDSVSFWSCEDPRVGVWGVVICFLGDLRTGDAQLLLIIFLGDLRSGEAQLFIIFLGDLRTGEAYLLFIFLGDCLEGVDKPLCFWGVLPSDGTVVS